MMNTFINKKLQNIFFNCFPQNCVLCKTKIKSANFICKYCNALLPTNEYKCSYINNRINKSIYFDNLISLWDYRFPIQKLIQEFKFNKALYYAPQFALLFFKYWLKVRNNENLALPDFLIPVPLHRKRLAMRGYNQSMEIARYLGKLFKTTINYKLCTRKIDTNFQTSLTAKQRNINVKHAFTLSNTNINNLHIAIIDDVITTGSTVNCIAKLLKTRGAAKVDIYTIAKSNIS